MAEHARANRDILRSLAGCRMKFLSKFGRAGEQARCQGTPQPVLVKIPPLIQPQ